MPATPPLTNVTGKIVLVIGNKIKYDLAVSLPSGLEHDGKALSDAAGGDGAALSLTPETELRETRAKNQSFVEINKDCDAADAP